MNRVAVAKSAGKAKLPGKPCPPPPSHFGAGAKPAFSKSMYPGFNGRTS